MLARDLACACLGWAFAAALWAGASRLPRSMLSDAFGADGLPRGLALLLFAVSSLIAARALLARRKARAPPDGAQARSETLREHAHALGIVVLGFGYVLAAPYLGYPATAALLIFATAVYYGARPGATLALVSAAGALFLWWMFARMLSVSMPAGTVWRMLAG